MRDRPAELPRFDEAHLDELHRALGLKRLNPLWAKLEILLGLCAAVVGLRLLPLDGPPSWAGGALIVLGLYLAMAGHRSHLYQSQNRQAAYLLAVIRREQSRTSEAVDSR